MPAKGAAPGPRKPSDARNDPDTGKPDTEVDHTPAAEITLDVTPDAPNSTDSPAPGVPDPNDPEAKFNTCGHTVNTANGDKPCVKPAGHDSNAQIMETWGSGHASRIQRRKEYETPDDEVFASFGEVPTEETADYGGGVGAQERDEKQLIVDGHVKLNYDAWVAAKKPKLGFNDSIKAGLASRYMLMPKDEEAMRHRIRSAARFHGIGVRIAKLKRHESGKHMLYWTAQDLQPHQKKETASATPAQDAAATLKTLLDGGMTREELAKFLAHDSEDEKSSEAGNGAPAVTAS